MGQHTLNHRRHRLAAPDVRELLRLCNELHHGTDEGDARKLKLLEGVRRLTDADAATATVVAFPPSGGKPGLVSAVNLGPGRNHAQNHEAPWDIYRRAHSRRERSLSAPAPAPASSADWCTTALYAPSRN